MKISKRRQFRITLSAGEVKQALEEYISDLEPGIEVPDTGITFVWELDKGLHDVKEVDIMWTEEE